MRTQKVNNLKLILVTGLSIFEGYYFVKILISKNYQAKFLV